MEQNIIVTENLYLRNMKIWNLFMRMIKIVLEKVGCRIEDLEQAEKLSVKTGRKAGIVKRADTAVKRQIP